MYSEYYAVEVEDERIEDAFKLYLKWCQNNNEVPEVLRVEEITDSGTLDHVLYHAEIEGFKVEEEEE